MLYQNLHDCQDDVIVPMAGDDLHTDGQAGAVKAAPQDECIWVEK